MSVKGTHVRKLADRDICKLVPWRLDLWWAPAVQRCPQTRQFDPEDPFRHWCCERAVCTRFRR
jgi:hypothetical protein